MTHPYDTLMDRLAALAVASVHHPDAAVQVYWLARLSAAWQADPSSPLTCELLLQREPPFSLPPWASALAPQALGQLLRAGHLIKVDGHRALLAPETVSWDDLAALHGMLLTLPQDDQPYADEIAAYMDSLWHAVCSLYGPRAPAWAQVPEEVLRGAVLFEAGLYFACHEYFETLWGRVNDEASAFYQGLIQIAVAMRHLESHNVRGAIKLMQYGLGRLQRYPCNYQGLPLTPFIEQLTSLLYHLQSLQPLEAYAFEATQVPRLLPPAA